MADDVVVIVEMTAGEDFSAQIFWTDEYGEPHPVSDPVLMDVKDANGQIAMRFSDQNDATTAPAILISGYVGYFQLTAPSEVTRTLPPGRYLFDLFSSVADSAPPFTRQLKRVFGGFVEVGARVTHIEDADSSTTTALPLGP